MDILKKQWWSYLIEIIIAIVIYTFSFEAFLIYALFRIIFEIARQTNYLRATSRIQHFYIEAKIMAITKKLKITDAEIQDVIKDIKSKTPEEQWDLIEKDFKEVTKY